MEEPNALMRWMMFHFAGGDALFLALLVGLAISFTPNSAPKPWRVSLIAFVAVIWGALSSPAWPFLGMLAVLITTVIWRLDVHWSLTPRRQRIPFRLFYQSSIIISGFGELVVMNNRWQPNLPVPKNLDVIADSITAGLNDGEITWPRLYAERTGIPVRDASQPGATLKSALKQAELLDDSNPLMLEIGGNDLLSGLPVQQFEETCDALLKSVCTPGRAVWMFELPLPPLCSRYGEAQRRLCRKHHVRLIPKRRLMSVLTTSGATVDSVHLTPRGQDLLFATVLGTLGNSRNSKKTTSSYEKVDRIRN